MVYKAPLYNIIITDLNRKKTVIFENIIKIQFYCYYRLEACSIFELTLFNLYFYFGEKNYFKGFI